MTSSNYPKIPDSCLFIIILPFSITGPLQLVDISAVGDVACWVRISPAKSY